MIDVLMESMPAGSEEECHVLFAGGIHDDLSASMVAAMAAPLADRGVKIGVLLGTAYLFTEEAVASGAIVKGFQEEAVRCEKTVTLETGPGHATRCADTPFADMFQEEKSRLIRSGLAQEEIRSSLEMLNLGRLRIASKGFDRDKASDENAAKKYVHLEESEQHQRGMYMIGQVAALRNRTCSMEELHRSVSVGATSRLDGRRGERPVVLDPEPRERPSAIAIIGMSCILPKAPDLDTYWNNILNRVDAMTEIPAGRWDWKTYFDPDPRAKDKIYSKWGGFLDETTFDPVEFGMPPNSLKSIDPMQLLALKAARRAMEDAGYWERPFDRSRASVILGASGGTGDLGASYLLRSSLPLILGDSAPAVIENANGLLPQWTEDSFAGLLLNVAAGRIANRFDFGGLNYVVDAACASSLAAVHQAVRELEAQATDLVLVGGVDTTQNPFGYLCFSKTRALSPTGRARTFDAEADGIAISEGIVMLVLKRLSDAERDGDRVYAVIRATAGSSDGRAKGMTAPRPEGQMAALRRAYRKAGFSPTTVGLFEAHGTGTVVGDRTEALALTTVLDEAGATRRSAAVGSVKSMIGHTKATAGVASLAKVALGLYHKVLPPTLGVTRPNPSAKLDDGPLYVNTETRPWIGSASHPRRAGASSFGFGGTNFHVVLEEYDQEFLPVEAATRFWPTELFLIAGDRRDQILVGIERLRSKASDSDSMTLESMACWAWNEAVKTSSPREIGPPLVLSIVAASREDLLEKLAAAATSITQRRVRIHDARGIYFNEQPQGGLVAFLFPGQGSQYPNMVRDLAIHFAEVRARFDDCDRALEGLHPEPLSRYVFPPPAFEEAQAREQQRALTETNVAQPALGAADTGISVLLGKLGVVPDLVAGHSYGEYVALAAAGVFDYDVLSRVSEARGRSIIESAGDDLGTMAAADASPAEVRPHLENVEDVWISNFNAPKQTILSGSRQGIEVAMGKLAAGGIHVRSLPVACAFHSPLVAPARRRLAEFLSGIELHSPQRPVYSNVTAARYPDEPAAIQEILAEHLEKPVLFADQISAMYEAGARIFVEVGPRNVLTGLTGQILADRPHVAIATDRPGRSGLTQLQHSLGILASEGVSLDLDRIFASRVSAPLDVGSKPAKPSPTTWLVNGSRARPISEPSRRPPVPEVEVRFPASSAPPEASRPVVPAPRNGKSVANENSPAPASIPTPAPTPAPAPAPAPQSAGRPISEPVDGAHGIQPAEQVPQVMVDFQRTMNRFLETQRSVMQAYLSASPSAQTDDRPVSAAVLPSAPEGTTPGPSVPAPPVLHVPVAAEAPPVGDRRECVERRPGPGRRWPEPRRASEETSRDRERANRLSGRHARPRRRHRGGARDRLDQASRDSGYGSEHASLRGRRGPRRRHGRVDRGQNARRDRRLARGRGPERASSVARFPGSACSGSERAARVFGRARRR